MEEETLEFIPTEPVPVEPGSPITYEQGERLIKAVEGLKEDISSNHETNTQAIADINTLLNDIKTNTIPVSGAPSPTEVTGSITFEQAQEIINLITSGLELAGYVAAGVFIWFVLKQLYKLFAGVLFGGV